MNNEYECRYLFEDTKRDVILKLARLIAKKVYDNSRYSKLSETNNGGYIGNSIEYTYPNIMQSKQEHIFNFKYPIFDNRKDNPTSQTDLQA